MNPTDELKDSGVRDLEAELHKEKIDKDSTVDYYRYMIEYALAAPSWAATLGVLHDALAGIKDPGDPRIGDTKSDFENYIEAVSYSETVDAMLDGTIPTKDKYGKPIYLKERVAMLLELSQEAAAWKKLALATRDEYGVACGLLGTAAAYLFAVGTYHQQSKGLPERAYGEMLELDAKIGATMKAVHVEIPEAIKEKVP